MEKTSLGSQEILSIIPHRYPFLHVDGILELDGEESATGFKNVSHNEPYLYRNPHELPRLPETIVIESMSQVGVVGILNMPSNAGKVMLFAAVEGLKFFRPVFAGDRLVSKVERVYLKGGLGKMKGKCWVNDEQVAEGFFSFALVDAVPKK